MGHTKHLFIARHAENGAIKHSKPSLSDKGIIQAKDLANSLQQVIGCCGLSDITILSPDSISSCFLTAQILKQSLGDNGCKINYQVKNELVADKESPIQNFTSAINLIDDHNDDNLLLIVQNEFASFFVKWLCNQGRVKCPSQKKGIDVKFDINSPKLEKGRAWWISPQENYVSHIP